MSLPSAVATLERELRGIFGPRVQSLVVYGERARRAHHDNRAKHSRHHGDGHDQADAVRTMAIVEGLTGDDLRACADRVTSWHEAGLATPLVLASHEFERSLDAFPLEVGAILADYTVAAGANPFEKLSVDRADVRRAVEVQARSHLLHLREGYIEAAGRPAAVAVLIAESAASFSALVMTLARLDGHSTPDAAAAARHAERLIAQPSGAVSEIVTISSIHDVRTEDADRLFPAYLDAVERLVTYIDQWR
jgi:hypothetical protein